MNNVETKEIPFYGDTLLGVRDGDGKVWLAVQHTCQCIGFTKAQADKQIKNIKSDLVFEGDWQYLSVQLDAQVRKVIVISENAVPLWLAKIKLRSKTKEENPEAVMKLIAYQKEAKEILHKAFYETDEQKESLHNSLGIEGEVANLKIAVEATTEQLKDQSEKLQKVMDNMTINTIQQGRLLSHAKDRVRFLLGGTHSDKYKEDSRKYFSNLWMNFKETFICASYKDLNPKYFGKALEFVDGWNYRER